MDPILGYNMSDLSGWLQQGMHTASCLAPGFTSKSRIIFGFIKAMLPIFVLCGHLVAYGAVYTFCWSSETLPKGLAFLRPKGPQEKYLENRSKEVFDKYRYKSDDTPAGALELSILSASDLGQPQVQESADVTALISDKRAKPVAPLTAGLYKSFLSGYGALTTSFMQLVSCVQQPGTKMKHYEFYAFETCANEEGWTPAHIFLVITSVLVVISPAILLLFTRVVRRTPEDKLPRILQDFKDVVVLHDKQLRSGLWWLPFVLALWRGSLIVLPSLVQDPVVGLSWRCMLVVMMLVVVIRVRPFADNRHRERVRTNLYHSLLFACLLFVGALNLGQHTLEGSRSTRSDEQEMMNNWSGYIIHFLSVLEGEETFGILCNVCNAFIVCFVLAGWFINDSFLKEEMRQTSFKDVVQRPT